VPEYLKLRFDEKTRAVNAVSFAIMTVFSSGISLYALAALLEVLLGWNFHFSVFVSAMIVLAYTFLGGLTAAIYNEVLQFFLIVLGFLPLTLLGLKDIGGWNGLVANLNRVATEHGYPAGAWTHSVAGLGSSHDNPMGVAWFSLVFGLGFVLSFGYWCTDFLVIQRALAAESLTAARRTPLIASIPKMLLPALTVLPGMIAIGLTARAAQTGAGFMLPTDASGQPNYNMAIPALLGHYFPPGLLGVGLTALMASFMSGMAGNVTAFNTVFTYDIYESYIRPHQPDSHYLRVGQFTTVAGIGVSVATAYVASRFNNIMDLLQLVFAFVNAPLFATFLLGMFWRRSTGHGAFTGLLCGTGAAAIHHGMTLPQGQPIGLKGGWLLGHSTHLYPSEMAQSFWTAIWAFGTCLIITIIISLLTQRTKSDDELNGLVYSLTPKVHERGGAWYSSPEVLGVVVVIAALTLCLIFW
ncbi:MAG: sodium/solute symporter, partial [Phycisphaerae bacterium]|nr:sodium/solute symporter [Phycisphaerae bacterium]